jgi:hypothetical protein
MQAQRKLSMNIVLAVSALLLLSGCASLKPSAAQQLPESDRAESGPALVHIGIRAGVCRAMACQFQVSTARSDLHLSYPPLGMPFLAERVDGCPPGSQSGESVSVSSLSL